MLFDSHTHLTAPDFDNDRLETLGRAHAAGVREMLAIGSGYGADSNRAAVAFANQQKGIWAAIGCHPHEAGSYNDSFDAMIRELIGDPKVVCVGEIGLDYFYDKSPRQVQQVIFRRMCALAVEAKLPVSIHSRNAFADTVDILRESKIGRIAGGVIHCFTAGPDEAKAYLQLGFHISIPGIVTYKSADSIRAALQVIPTEKLLLETDAPYLAPIPYRGRRNEPAFVAATAAFVAAELHLEAADIARITTRNAHDLLHLPHNNEARVAYTIRNSTYLNITNRCTLACTFCPKFKDWMVKGHYLELPDEPDLETIIAQLREEEWQTREEIVFCGYGEPTQRLDMLLQVGSWIKQHHPAGLVRLNTDGLATLIHGRDILPDLFGVVDVLSISLNADDPDKYTRYCPNPYGAEAWEACVEFVRRAAGSNRFKEVRVSAVTMPTLNLDSMRTLVESLGATFRPRELNVVG